MNDTTRSCWRNVPATTAVHAPPLSTSSIRTLPALHDVPCVMDAGAGGCVNVTWIGSFAARENGWYLSSAASPPEQRPGLAAVPPVSVHGTPGWMDATASGTVVAARGGVEKLIGAAPASWLPATSA